MNPGFKFPIDENMLRSKLQETKPSNMEKAWEQFESYLSQQKPLFVPAKRTRLYWSVHPRYFFRGLIACLLVLPTLIFYRQFNSAIPKAIGPSSPITALKPVKPANNQKPQALNKTASLQSQPILPPEPAKELAKPEVLKIRTEKSGKPETTRLVAASSDSSGVEKALRQQKTTLTPASEPLPPVIPDKSSAETELEETL